VGSPFFLSFTPHWCQLCRNLKSCFLRGWDRGGGGGRDVEVCISLLASCFRPLCTLLLLLLLFLCVCGGNDGLVEERSL